MRQVNSALNPVAQVKFASFFRRSHKRANEWIEFGWWILHASCTVDRAFIDYLETIRFGSWAFAGNDFKPLLLADEKFESPTKWNQMFIVVINSHSFSREWGRFGVESLVLTEVSVRKLSWMPVWKMISFDANVSLCWGGRLRACNRLMFKT